MAGDWIKMEKATAYKPEILRLADLLSIHPAHAFGLCFRFWSWADDQLIDGHAVSVTNVTLDSVIGHAGFTSALINVGWLQVRSGSLVIPHFDRHLSESAKNRALSAERKKKQRVSVSRSERDKSVTREEKRRVTISVPDRDEIHVPVAMRGSDVQQAAALWFSHLKVTAPDKVPIANSPQLEAFWRDAARLGPEEFIRTVEHCVSRGWINLRRRDQGDGTNRGRPNGKAAEREQANADAFAVAIAAAEATNAAIGSEGHE